MVHPNEEQTAEELLHQVTDAAESVVVEGMEAAMSRFNS